MTIATPVHSRAAMTSRDVRLTTIFLVGRISNGVRDDLCRVRNISAGGLRIETLARIDVGERIWVELKNGVVLRSEVVWVKNAEAGVRFEVPVDVARMLAPDERSRRLPGLRVTRSPRLSARCPAALRRAGYTRPGVVTNISQGGAQILVDGVVTVGDQFDLGISGLCARRAAVCWQDRGVLGISFVEKIGFSELSLWLAGPDRFAPEPAVLLNPIRQSS